MKFIYLDFAYFLFFLIEIFCSPAGCNLNLKNSSYKKVISTLWMICLILERSIKCVFGVGELHISVPSVAFVAVATDPRPPLR